MAEQDPIEPLPAFKRGSFFLLPVSLTALLSCLVITSCSDDNKSTMGNIDPEIFPTMLTTDVSTYISDSGYTRYHLIADQWLMYDEAKEPHWTFPDGIYMEKYDDDMNVESTFRSDSASYLSQKRIWEFNGDVRMKNTDGDRFATEQLFWNQQEQKVYSDSFIHIERIDRVLEGYGFVSNEQMTEYTILNVSGIFPTPQRREEKVKKIDNDSIVVDTVTTTITTSSISPSSPAKTTEPTLQKNKETAKEKKKGHEKLKPVKIK